MTGTKDGDRDRLRRLNEALVDDLLATPDDAIVAEVKESGEDPKAVVSASRAVFETAVASHAKSRLAAAKSAVAEDRKRTHRVVRFDPTEARKRLEDLVANDPTMAGKFTIAARKEGGLSDEDVCNLLEDFEELGIDSQDGRSESEK